MYFSGAQPYLHSFPTRRSSDLGADDGDGRVLALEIRHGAFAHGGRDLLHAQRRRGVSQAPVRSEEHTSELQSHSELVCRLLLEKKKHNIKSLDLRASLQTPNQL